MHLLFRSLAALAAEQPGLMITHQPGQIERATEPDQVVGASLYLLHHREFEKFHTYVRNHAPEGVGVVFAVDLLAAEQRIGRGFNVGRQQCRCRGDMVKSWFKFVTYFLAFLFRLSV
jgi:hypothetical protein